MARYSNTTDEQDPVRCPACHNIMDPFVMPVVSVLGILGNLLAIVVVLLTKLRRHPPSSYLIALAISDTVFLIDQILLLHRACNRVGVCQMCIFLTYLAPATSGWLLVGFTFERFIVVVYPIRQLQWGSWRATRVFIVLVLVVGVLVSAPTLYTAEVVDDGSGSGQGLCAFRSNSSLALAMEPPHFYMEMALSFFVPFLSISILNCFIIRAVRQSVRLQQSMDSSKSAATLRSSQKQQKGKNSASHNSNNSNNGASFSSSIGRAQRTKREQTSAAITRMLILVSATFVITNLPTYVLRVYTRCAGRNDSVILALQVTEYPYQLNFTLNFLLYSFSSGTFRGALCKLCCRCFTGPTAPLRSTDTQLGNLSHTPRASAGAYVELQRMGGSQHRVRTSTGPARPTCGR